MPTMLYHIFQTTHVISINPKHNNVFIKDCVVLGMFGAVFCRIQTEGAVKVFQPACVTHAVAFATQSFTHFAFLVHLLDTSRSCCCSFFFFHRVETFALNAACGEF